MQPDMGYHVSLPTILFGMHLQNAAMSAAFCGDPDKVPIATLNIML